MTFGKKKACSRSQIMRLAADGNSVGKRDGKFFFLLLFSYFLWNIREDYETDV